MPMGLMEEIKEHLEEDVSSGELIALGYRPATVYKAQRAWRDAKRQAGEPQDKLGVQPAIEATKPTVGEELEEETDDNSEALQTELKILRLQAEGVEATIDELDEVVLENDGLKKQLAAMKLEAKELAHSRQRVKLLESDQHFSQHARANLQRQLNSSEENLKDRSNQCAILEQRVSRAKTLTANLANENAS